jgi:hypothetical protein
MDKDNLDFWKDFLNNRAGELGLDKNIKVVKSLEDAVGPMTWVYEQENGDLIDLGWSVEQAEAGLRELAGA